MKRRCAGRRARSVLGWMALFVVLLQIALTVILDGWRPEIYDAEYEIRLGLLRARLAENPDRPLLLMLGSSRTTMGFRPEILPPLGNTDEPQPLPFNFSLYGSGPTRNLLILDRLLRQGIRPRWLVVELMPAKLSHDSDCWSLSGATFGDLLLLQRYIPAWKVASVYLRIRLCPWYKQRTRLLRELAPAWLQPDTKLEIDGIDLDPLGGDTRWQVVKQQSAERRQQQNDFIRSGYEPEFRAFHIKDGPGRATEDLLALCRREHIGVVLVLTPESKTFQGYYPPAALAQLDEFGRKLQRVYGVPVIDARDFLPDEEFLDGHHPLMRGAETFTLRLGRDVLRPLVAGSLGVGEGCE